jgi:hypothetical protein
VAQAPEVVSPNLQIQLIRRLRKEGTPGFCIQVQDPAALAGELEALRASGAAVVTMLRAIKSPEPFLHAGVNADAVGVALAKAVAEQIPEPGTLGVLSHDGDPLSRLRRQGFDRQILRHPHLTVLRRLDCGGDPVAAVKLVSEAMERFPGIDGWVSMGPWPLQRPEGSPPLLPLGCVLAVPGPLTDFDHQIGTDRCQIMVIANYDAIVSRALGMCEMVLQQEMVHVRIFETPPRWVSPETLVDFRHDWAAWTGTPVPPPAKLPDLPPTESP